MKELQTTVRCDFCGWGGPYCDPAWFREVAGADLCRYCGNAGPVPVQIETGGHCVTFTDDGRDWKCTCGERHRRPLLIPRYVLDAVPSVSLAVALTHLNGRRTPA